MDKFSTKQIIELYQMMGLKDPKFLSEKNVENLFKILKIEPIFNEDGIRQLTPYELLGVLPVFEKGKEKMKRGRLCETASSIFRPAWPCSVKV